MIPFVDLSAQYINLKSEINTAINNVLHSTNFVLGPEVECFEEEFAAYIGTKYAISVNSAIILPRTSVRMEKVVQLQPIIQSTLIPLE